ncbi:MAG: hypothetical protein WD556_11385 [Actinomycetota bacterium]
MSQLADIIERVVGQLQAIDGIGNVHDRMRLAQHEGDVENQLLIDVEGDLVLRVWYVHLGKMRSTPEGQGGTQEWVRDLVIEGWMQFEDANGSESAVVSFAEEIIRVLWADVQATRFGETVLFGKPASIEDLVPRQFANLVCSYVRLVMPVTTIEIP